MASICARRKASTTNSRSISALSFTASAWILRTRAAAAAALTSGAESNSSSSLLLSLTTVSAALAALAAHVAWKSCSTNAGLKLGAIFDMICSHGVRDTKSGGTHYLKLGTKN
ncbi:hypothetical protein PF010_g21145 [Phytophthora fragariae]|uniref:Uncharacterized protein n=1 Tax=Phytophthora fragariae TaxID=53985 RepID=A0A6A3IPS7_9STRA|nr:hypothetical protein PF011_g20592 [Phytophthora fragariae]KAE9083616.1 hypothetical protein PF010_g21145 [Phytophthora fragariae]